MNKQLTHLDSITADIRSRMKRSVEDIIEIGKHLKYVKENVLEHGEFQNWHEQEFNMQQQEVSRVVSVFERFGDQTTQIASFGVSTVYELAKPSTPEEAVQEALSRDEPLSVKDVKKIINSHKPDGKPAQPNKLTPWKVRNLFLDLTPTGQEEFFRSIQFDQNNPYTALQVTEGADAAVVKAAYKVLASQHYPDKGGDPKVFQKIQDAYDELK